MNYRHAYHAGNFADVLKHVTLALVIDYLKRKDAPFRIVDTHAGIGRYDLGSIQSAKTGEWRSGIGRLIGPEAEPLPADVASVLKPYLDAVLAENAPGSLDTYPGSPLIARRLMRNQDVLVANELHPADRLSLEAAVGRDRRVKVLGLDGWVALKSLLPPKEKRGVVLIDPPFEAEGELTRLADGLGEALRRFETGTYLAWYPIKDPKPVARFLARISELGPPEWLRVELLTRSAAVADRLNGCGLIVVNAPFTLADQLATALPLLTRRLALGQGACHRIESSARIPSATSESAAPPTSRKQRSAPRSRY